MIQIMRTSESTLIRSPNMYGALSLLDQQGASKCFRASHFPIIEPKLLGALSEKRQADCPASEKCSRGAIPG